MTWLIATMGTSPAVLTEAIWYLEHKEGLDVDRVTCIGTQTARSTAMGKLLGPEGSLARLRKSLSKPEGWLLEGETLCWADEPLAAGDNRNRSQALAMDRTCRRVIREAQEQGEGPVIACISGGRKTMSSSLQQALTLLARPEDWAFHVLLQTRDGLESKEVENPFKDFGFPDDPAYPSFRGKVELDVFEIPIVRLRDFALGLDHLRLLDDDYITGLQRTVNEATAIPRLRLDLKHGGLSLAWGKQAAFEPTGTSLSLHQRVMLATWILAGNPILQGEACPSGAQVKEARKRLRASVLSPAVHMTFPTATPAVKAIERMWRLGVFEELAVGSNLDRWEAEEDLCEKVSLWSSAESKTFPPTKTSLNAALIDIHPALERFTIKSRWSKSGRGDHPHFRCQGFADDVYARDLISIEV